MKKIILTLFLVSIYLFITAQTETELTLHTSDGKKLYGSLLLPKKKGAFDIVILISGSGPTDRDGNNPLMKNNALKYLAEKLAKNKIAAFRFDKRGVAKSKDAITSEKDLRFDTYVNDVIEWVNLLAKNEHINRIFIAGHSEGSLIGMVALNKLIQKNENLPIAGFISIAGAGKPANEILKEQLSKSLKDTILLQKSFEVINQLKNGKTVNDVPGELYTLFRPSVQPYLISWFAYNPQAEMAKLSVPALIIQGDADLQISVNDAQLLNNSNNQISKMVIISKMNHVLKTVENLEENQASYSNPEFPLNKKLIESIVEFVKS
jgi:hypothetical protein